MMKKQTKQLLHELEIQIQSKISEIQKLEKCNLESAENLMNAFLEDVNVISHHTDDPGKYTSNY